MIDYEKKIQNEIERFKKHKEWLERFKNRDIVTAHHIAITEAVVKELEWLLKPTKKAI